MFKAEMFETQIGSEFAVGGHGYDDVLTLTAVTRLPQGGSYTLDFRSARTDIMFDQQTIALVHAELGTLEIMLTPRGRDADGVRYDAIFG